MQRTESENESNEIVIHQLPSPPATRTKNFSFASTYQPSTGQFIKTQSNDSYLPNSKVSKPVNSFSLLNYDDIYETAPFVSRKPNAIVHPIRRSEQTIQHDTEEQQELQQLQEEPENDSDSTHTAHSLSYPYEVSGSSVTQPPISRPLFNYAHDFAEELDRKLRYLYSRHARPGWNTTGYENSALDSEKNDKDKDDINSSELPHRKLFITTVPTGIFLPPPKEMPLPQFLRPYSYYSRPMVMSERHTSCFDESPPFPKEKLREFAAPIKKGDYFTTSKTAPPSILSSSSRVNDSYSDSLTSGVHLTKEQFLEQIQQRRGKRDAPKEPYKNVMFDRRVVRGSNFSKNRKQKHNETSEHYAEGRYHHTLGQRPTKERLKRSVRSKTRQSTQRDKIVQTDDEILTDFKKKPDDVSVNTQTDFLSFPNEPIEGDNTKTKVHYEMFEHSYEQRHYHKLFRGTEIMQMDKIIQTDDELLAELVKEHYETSTHSVSSSLYHKLTNVPISVKRKPISRSRSLESTLRSLNGKPNDALLIELKKKRDNLCSVNTQTEPLVLPNHNIQEKAKNYVDATTATVELYKTAGLLAEEASFNNLSRSMGTTQPDKVMQTGDELLKKKKYKFSAISPTEPLTISNAAVEEGSTNRILGDIETQEDYKTSSVEGRYSQSSCIESINDRQKRSVSLKRFESNLQDETKKDDDTLLIEIRKKLDELLTRYTLNKYLPFSNKYFEEKTKAFEETSTKTDENNVISEQSFPKRFHYILGNEPSSGGKNKMVRSRSFESTLRFESKQNDIELLMEISKKLDGLISTDSFSETSDLSDFSSNERVKDFADVRTEPQECYLTSKDYADGRHCHRLVQRPVHRKLKGIISSSSFQCNFRDEVIQTDDQLKRELKQAGDELCSVSTQTEFLPSFNDLKAKNYLDASTATDEHYLIFNHSVSRSIFHTLSNNPHNKREGIVRSKSFESTMPGDLKQIDDSLFREIQNKLNELLAVNTEIETSSNGPIEERTKICIDVSTETEEHYSTSDHSVTRSNFHTLSNEPQDGQKKGIVRSKSFESSLRSEITQMDDSLFLEMKKKLNELLALNTEIKASSYDPIGERTKSCIDVSTETEEHYVTADHSVTRRNFHTLNNEPQDGQQKRIVRSKSFESSLRSEIKQIDESLFLEIKKKLDELLAVNTQTETEGFSHDPIGERTKNFIDVSTETEVTSDYSVARRNFHTLSNEPQDGQQKLIVRSKSFKSSLRSEMKQMDDSLFLEMKKKLNELLAINTEIKASSYDPIGERTKSCIDVSTETEDHYATADHSVARRNFYTLNNKPQDGQQKGIFRSKSFESTLRSEMTQVDDSLFLEIKKKLDELLAVNTHTETEASSNDPIGERTKNCTNASTATDEHYATPEHPVARKNFNTSSYEPQNSRPTEIFRSKSFESSLHSEMKQIDDSLFLEIKKKLDELLAVNTQTETEGFSNDPIGERTKNCKNASTSTEAHYSTSEHSIARRNFDTLNNEPRDERLKAIVRSKSFESTLRTEIHQPDCQRCVEMRKKQNAENFVNAGTELSTFSNNPTEDISVITGRLEQYDDSEHSDEEKYYATLSKRGIDGRRKRSIPSNIFESTLGDETKKDDDKLLNDIRKRLDDLLAVNTQTRALAGSHKSVDEKVKECIDYSTKREDHFANSKFPFVRSKNHTLDNPLIEGSQNKIVHSKSFDITLPNESKEIDDKILIQIGTELDGFIAGNTHSKQSTFLQDDIDENTKSNIAAASNALEKDTSGHISENRSKSIEKIRGNTQKHYPTIDQRPIIHKQDKIVHSRSFESSLWDGIKQADEESLGALKKKHDDVCSVKTQTEHLASRNDIIEKITKKYVDACIETDRYYMILDHSVARKTFHKLSNKPQDVQQKGVVRSKSFESTLRSEMTQIDDSLFLEIKNKHNQLLAVNTEIEASSYDPMGERTKSCIDASTETEEHYATPEHPVARRNFNTLSYEPQNSRLKEILRSKSFESTLLGEIKQIDDSLLLDIKKKLDELLAVNLHMATEASSNDPVGETNKNYTYASTAIEEHNSTSDHSVAKRNFHTLSNEPQDRRQNGIVRSKSFESSLSSEIKQIDDILLLELKKKLDELLAVNTHMETEASSNDPIGERTKSYTDASTATEEPYATLEYPVARRNFNISSYEPQNSRLKEIVRSKSFESTLSGEIKQADDKLLIEIKKKLIELLSTNTHTHRTAIPNDHIENISKNDVTSTAKEENLPILVHSLEERYLKTSSRTFQTTQRDKIIQTDDELLTEHKKIRNELSVKTQTELVIFLNDSSEENAITYVDPYTEKEELNEAVVERRYLQSLGKQNRIFEATNRDEIKQIANKMTMKCDGLTSANTQTKPWKNESLEESGEIFMDISSDTEEHHMCLEADVVAETLIDIFIDMCFEDVVIELISGGQIDDNDKEENEAEQSRVPSAKKDLHDEANHRDDTTAAQLLQGHIAKLVPEVLENLESAAYMEPEKKEEVMKAICPWLTVEVAEEVGHIVDSREILTVIVEEIIKQRSAAYSDINDMPEIIANIEEIVEISNDGDNNRNDSKDGVIL